VEKEEVNQETMYHDYVFGKQTIKQISEKYGISKSTVQRRFKAIHSEIIISKDKEIVVLMDTTYWGWDFGVVVMKDAKRKKILWRKYIDRKEKLSDYEEGIQWLEGKGFKIKGIVCDGLRGIYKTFAKYKIQMCQFHQVQIIRRYLTQKPELEASKELMKITRLLTITDKYSFIGMYNEWRDKWKDFINERRTDEKGKRVYIHRRLRSASLSIKRNMPYLLTWYDNKELGIPNTNNALEGKFTDLKTKLRNHNGLSKEHRKIFIDKYFKETFK
jgi:DNA-binding Lrp family transcriptional regulator